MTRARTTILGALTITVALLQVSVASAWPHEGDEVHPGLIYRRLEGPVKIQGAGALHQVIHVLYADAWNSSLSFVAPRPADRNLTISQFADRYQVHAAINANYFDVDRASCGLAVGEGEVWPDSYHHLPWGRCSDSVGFSESNDVTFFDSYDDLTGPLPPGVETVVTGMPTLIRDGVVTDLSMFRSTDYPPNLTKRNPRTAVCTHTDDRTVVLAVVEGRAPLRGRAGMTGIVLARFMREVLGCHNAVALDGGGSSAMFVRGLPQHDDQLPGIVSRIPSGDERRLGSHLGIRIVDGPSQWAAELVDQSPVPTVVAGETFDLWVRYRNRGRRTWRSDGPWPVALVTDEPEAHLSLLYSDEEWLTPMSPTRVDEATLPGELGTFVFRAVAPTEAGIYPLVVSPVADGAGRLNATPVRWELVVGECP